MATRAQARASHQSNKPFKGARGHKSKGAIKRKVTGRVAGTPAGRNVKAGSSAAGGKANRRNAMKVAMRNKRDAATTARRVGQGSSAPPKIVGLVPLSTKCDQLQLRAAVLKACAVDIDEDIDEDMLSLPANVTLPSWRTRVSLHVAPNSMFAILDLCKVHFD